MLIIRHGQSHFNLHFSKTRVDPGIVDPVLTEEGKAQIAKAAAALASGERRFDVIVTSPYRRTLESAEILAEALDLPVAIEPIIRERAFFVCDIGSPRSALQERFPKWDFAELPERWWPEPEETEIELRYRCHQFRLAMAGKEDWSRHLVVSHWGFIRGLTGRSVENAARVPFDPTLA